MVQINEFFFKYFSRVALVKKMSPNIVREFWALQAGMG